VGHPVFCVAEDVKVISPFQAAQNAQKIGFGFAGAAAGRNSPRSCKIF
jgi:hypothetical protein